MHEELNPQLTFLAEIAGESLDALARALDTVSVSVAVGDLALLVPEVALLALPAGLADALPVHVVAVAVAEQRANA